MDLSGYNIGFIGAGNMAKAIGGGIIKKGLVKPDTMMASAPSMKNLQEWKGWGVPVTHNNSDVIAKCNIVFLAVKPHLLEKSMEGLKIDDDRVLAFKRNEICIVSVMAGLTIERVTATLAKHLSRGDRHHAGVLVIRTVPSTPCQLGVGCCGYALSQDDWRHADLDFPAAVETVFTALGVCRRFDESQLNAVCGAFGSGVAFMLSVIDAMAGGAVKAGLPWDAARQMAAQTALGAAQMALQTGKHLCQLRDEVSSPGGTTIAGLQALEDAGVRAGMMKAVEAAVRRGEEMGK